MQNYFYELADYLGTLLEGDEVYTAWFEGESSDFVRFNNGKVRQPGTVDQRTLSVSLIRGSKHVSASLNLTGSSETDRSRVKEEVSSLRGILADIPEDPYLLYATQPHSTEDVAQGSLPDAVEVTNRICQRAADHDFVGIYAGGHIYRGFANSLGQRNWFARQSFNLDWSLYHQADKAVKSSYAGFQWSDDDFASRYATSAEALKVLQTPAKTIDPGSYRAYLTPAAMCEILQLLSWGDLGTKAHQTKTTALLKLAEGKESLNSGFSMSEDTQHGAGPAFGSKGFLKPGAVDFVREGKLVGTLCSPRSSKEYGLETNGSESEMPTALRVGTGTLPSDNALSELGTGIYVSNLWYLNYSDRSSCRITGMTRFATMWAENGKLVAPLNVMRFDETLYRLLGTKLEALTSEAEFVLDPETYGQRSTRSYTTPGALVSELRFTL